MFALPNGFLSCVSAEAMSEKLFLRGNHPALARVIEQAAGVHDGADVAERFEFDDFAGRLDGDGGGVEVNGHDVAGLQGVAEAFGDFARIEFAGGDGVAEKNARETFGEHELTVG